MVRVLSFFEDEVEVVIARAVTCHIIKLGLGLGLDLVVHYFIDLYFHSVHFNVETARSLTTP